MRKKLELSDEARDLLMEIVKCQNFRGKNGCRKIFDSQEDNPDKWLPVPWQGHIEQAKILFISSNPSPLKTGCLASKSWIDKDEIEKIIDFYERRFDENNPYKWTSGGTRYLLKSGEQSKREVLYWKVLKNSWVPAISKCCPEGKIKTGETYALTEIVHCYSREEAGVEEAKEECSRRYLRRLLQVARDTKIIVIGGRHATHIINENFEKNDFGIKTCLDYHPLKYTNGKGETICKILPGMVQGIIRSDDGKCTRKLKFIALPHASCRFDYKYDGKPIPKQLVPCNAYKFG